MGFNIGSEDHRPDVVIDTTTLFTPDFAVRRLWVTGASRLNLSVSGRYGADRNQPHYDL